jgi:hypothetical protein
MTEGLNGERIKLRLIFARTVAHVDRIGEPDWVNLAPWVPLGDDRATKPCQLATPSVPASPRPSKACTP